MIEKGEARLLGGIIFVAPVRVYWKFIFCASTARASIVNTRLLSVNARLLIAVGTAFNAITLIESLSGLILLKFNHIGLTDTLLREIIELWNMYFSLTSVINGCMTRDFTSCSTAFKSYQDDRRKIMNRCVQWNPVYDWKYLSSQGSNPVPLNQQASSNNKCAYFLVTLILFQPFCSTVYSIRPVNGG